MLEGLKDALEHVEDLARENEKTEVVEICGHTYANKTLRRYDTAKDVYKRQVLSCFHSPAKEVIERTADTTLTA